MADDDFRSDILSSAFHDICKKKLKKCRINDDSSSVINRIKSVSWSTSRLSFSLVVKSFTFGLSEIPSPLPVWPVTLVIPVTWLGAEMKRSCRFRWVTTDSWRLSSQWEAWSHGAGKLLDLCRGVDGPNVSSWIIYQTCAVPLCILNAGLHPIW